MLFLEFRVLVSFYLVQCINHKDCIVILLSVSLLVLPPVVLGLIGVLWSVAVFIPQRKMSYTMLLIVPLLLLTIRSENKIIMAISLYCC